MANKSQALDIIEMIKKGQPFEVAATRYSQDISSKKNGGSLGWIDLDALPNDYLNTVLTLKAGEISNTPVKAQGGYGVIKLDEVRMPSASCVSMLKTLTFFDSGSWNASGIGELAGWKKAWDNINRTQFDSSRRTSYRVKITPSLDCSTVVSEIDVANDTRSQQLITNYTITGRNDTKKSIVANKTTQCVKENGKNVECPESQKNVDIICINKNCWNLNTLQDAEMFNYPELFNSPLLPENRKSRVIAWKHNKYLKDYNNAASSQELLKFITDYSSDDPDDLVSKVKARLVVAQKREKYDKYLNFYKRASSTLELLQFITDYSNDDPDKLLSKAKAKLIVAQKSEKHDKYLNAFQSASSSFELLQFIKDYSNDDTDNLVSKAKAKLVVAQKREKAEQQEYEQREQSNKLACRRLYVGKPVTLTYANRGWGNSTAKAIIVGIGDGVASARVNGGDAYDSYGYGINSVHERNCSEY